MMTWCVLCGCANCNGRVAKGPTPLWLASQFILHTESHWYFGGDNTGNLMHAANLRSLAAVVRAKGPVRAGRRETCSGRLAPFLQALARPLSCS